MAICDMLVKFQRIAYQLLEHEVLQASRDTMYSIYQFHFSTELYKTLQEYQDLEKFPTS